MKYPVITLWQPWAQFIANGWKTIETRTHHRFFGLKGRNILIHAGAKWDKNWIEHAEPWMDVNIFDQATQILKVEPQILCMAYVDNFGPLNQGHSSKALINCFPVPLKRYGLFLSDIQRNEPIYIKGHQGIWYVDQSILEGDNQ